MPLRQIADTLVEELKPLRFGAPVTHVYNPLEYARAPYRELIKRYGTKPREAILLGMNPGPWGMAQTGVPFGEISIVRDWLGIKARVKKPEQENPKRPIDGFDCQRSEVSGKRLWGWARDTYKTPDKFFKTFFVANYCPLVFMEAGGKNITPDKLTADQRQSIQTICDEALRKTVETLKPRIVIGVGAFAEKQANRALEGFDVTIGRILHPSPASPAANKGWAIQAKAQLAEYDLDSP